jgi:outer membrane autotransporter protein
MDNNNTRRIVFPGIDRTASSSPGGRQYIAYAGTGYDIRKNAWTIAPNISFQYARTNIDSYEESGAGGLNLHVDGQATESMQGMIGVKVARLCYVDSCSVMPFIRAAYAYEFLKDSNKSITSFFLQGSSAFATETFPVNRNFLTLGLGFIVMKNQDLSVSLNYNAQIGDAKYIFHNFSAGLRLRF